MSLKIEKSIHRCLVSTTSRLLGQYESDILSVHHAWQPLNSHQSNLKITEGPASRNAYVVSFIIEPPEPRVGSIVPNYGPIGDIITSFLSLLFGKRFDNHGLIQSNGWFFVPNQEKANTICNPALPQNSHSARPDFRIPLNLTEVSRIELLITPSLLDKHFIETFITCCKFYSLALQIFEQDAEVAYLNLITAGEVLSNFYDIDKSELLSSEIRKYFSHIESQMDNGQQIVAALSGQMLQVKKRFTYVLLDLISDDFFNSSTITESYGRLTKENIENSIRAAYDLRSKFVHTGISFGTYISDSGPYEIQIGKPVLQDKDLAKILGVAPTFVGLERIIRHCLLKFAQNNNIPI